MNNLKLLRSQAGLTQGQLAERCGWVSQPRIGHYETGRRSPKIEDAHLIVGVLKDCGVDCNIDDVFPTDIPD